MPAPRTLAVLLIASALLLGSCGGEDEQTTEPPPSTSAEVPTRAEETADLGPAEPELGETFTYPDGLAVTLGGYEPHDFSSEYVEETIGMSVDVTATNESEDVLEVKQSFMSARYGDAGEEANEQGIIHTDEYGSIDAVLQPGAEATGRVALAIPPERAYEHVTITVQWWSDGESQAREPVTFTVPDAAGQDAAPATETTTEEPTTRQEAPPAETSGEEDPVAGGDLGARALDLRDKFRSDHEDAVAREGEAAHCYDDQTEPLADGTAAATCFLAEGGIVLFVATDPNVVDPFDLGFELMNGEVPYTVCAGDDYVLATPSIAAADMIYESGFDCTFP